MYHSNIPDSIKQLGPWFHNLHLPDGSQTAPDHFLGDFPRCQWQQIEGYLPDKLNDLKILDIGCNAGFYSFELARRGAMMTAVDIDARYIKQARWAAELYNLDEKIGFRQQPFYNLANTNEQYDIVWFMGVFHHLRYPLLALDLIRQRCRGRLVFQTMTMVGETDPPAPHDYDPHDPGVMAQVGSAHMAFVENGAGGNPPRWWVPNHAAVKAILRAAGFGNIQRIGDDIYLCESVSPPDAADELFSVIKRRQ